MLTDMTEYWIWIFRTSIGGKYTINSLSLLKMLTWRFMDSVSWTSNIENIWAIIFFTDKTSLRVFLFHKGINLSILSPIYPIRSQTLSISFSPCGLIEVWPVTWGVSQNRTRAWEVSIPPLIHQSLSICAYALKYRLKRMRI